MVLSKSLPDEFENTRVAFHKLAEHVLAAARYQREQRIGLRVTENGFGTPENSQWQLRIDGTQLVAKRHGQEFREPITTLESAAKFAECELGAPANVYTPSTTCEPDQELNIDEAATKFLAEWFAFADSQLSALRERLNSSDSTEIQLWPEHFDLSLEDGNETAGLRAGYGASPGDAHYNEPYIYVVPWQAQQTNPIWNAVGFSGHVTTFQELSHTDDPVGLIQARFLAAREAIDLQQ